MRCSYVQKHALSLFISLLAATTFAQGPGGGPPPPSPVSYMVVEPRIVPISYEAIGVTEPSRRVEIRSRIEGYLEKRDFVEGTEIEEGAVLFEIDPRSLEADRDIALARVAEAKTRLKLAESELSRVEGLMSSGAVSEGEVDKRAAERDTAAASVRLAEAGAAKAELELSYTIIKSPLKGLIGKTTREVGSFVDKGANGLLAEVTQVDPMYAQFRVSERLFLDWKNDVAAGRIRLPEGNRAKVQLMLADGKEYSEVGLLSFEDVKMDLRSGTMEIRGEFPNPELELKEGQYVRGHIVGWERADVITVPQRAVLNTAQGSFIYVLDAENKATMRPVVLGDWIENDWIIKSGLETGERIVVDGTNKIRPNSVVAPELLAAATAKP
jgi:membrane fusion protein (multidrug efflux system)